MCDCGYSVENALHYFLECSSFSNQRNELLLSLNNIQDINLDQMINGSPAYDDNTHEHIILSVMKFIKDSGRFA